ncbi:MAG: protein kinase [Gallionellaceae bacterium]|jgi:serine/threonine protein kinase|nr:protein kinase [Gallionellaceae bacterium]
MAATASSLPLTTRLGEFELTGVLGEGGFSVVYLALDHSLERTVAIKEYMPSTIATRMPDGTVVPKSPKHEEAFKTGVAGFLKEARLLSRFTHSALIHIHRVWEQNGTAYMAMQYCVGKTLRQLSQAEPESVRNEGWLKATFAPILDALELLHAENCLHRDISPDNILVLQTGEPILLDFGAARQIIGDTTQQALTVVLKPGFAPIEQYADDASLEQGPWTDIYGVGALLYYLITGKPPAASVTRLIKDPISKLADADGPAANISHSFRAAIDRALAVYPNQRIQSIADLREALQLPTFKPSALFSGTAARAVASPTTETQPSRPTPTDSPAQQQAWVPDERPSPPPAPATGGIGAQVIASGTSNLLSDALDAILPEPPRNTGIAKAIAKPLSETEETPSTATAAAATEHPIFKRQHVIWGAAGLLVIVVGLAGIVSALHQT